MEQSPDQLSVLNNINENTKLLKTIRTNFKPSLLTRIIFNGGALSESPNDAAELSGLIEEGPSVENMVGGEAVKLSQGKVLNLPTFVDHFMARAFVKLFVLIVAMYLSFRFTTSKIIGGKILKNVEMDPSAEVITGSGLSSSEFKAKYRKIILLLFVFIILAAIFNWLLMKIPYLILLAYFKSNKKMADNVPALAKESYENIFNKFAAKEGYGNHKFYTTLQRYALFGIFLIFIIYFLLVKSFISNMRYADYALEGEEHTTEKKFILLYMVTVVFFILFLLGLFCAHFTYKDPITLIYMIIMIALFSLFFTFTLSYELKRQPIKVMIFFFVLLILVILNAKFLTET